MFWIELWLPTIVIRGSWKEHKGAIKSSRSRIILWFEAKMPFATDHCMIAVVLQDLGERSYVGTDIMINTEEARMRQEK